LVEPRLVKIRNTFPNPDNPKPKPLKMWLVTSFKITGIGMKISTKKNALQYERDNIRSFLLVAESTVGAQHITTSLVEMEPGGIQKPHRHKTEQCYMILEGKGIMDVDGEKAAIAAGDTIFIPSNNLHSLRNEGKMLFKVPKCRITGIWHRE
jgi:quercetin dioxygenase-like cupin family protein